VTLLRLTQSAGAGGRGLEVAVEGAGRRRAARCVVPGVLAEADEEALRWYLEDYLDGPQDPVTASLASRAQDRQRELGGRLFDAVFGAEGTRAIWSALRPRLREARVEVVTDLAGAVAVPWELMRDPATDTPLALAARSFVRAHPQAAQTPWLPERADTVRVLLVISRPRGRAVGLMAKATDREGRTRRRRAAAA
jgi:hypothetical protein